MADRLEALRDRIDQIVHAQPDLTEKRCGFVHLYGVSAICVLLAERRGISTEIAAVAGMLHDIWAYKKSPQDHALLGAVEAARILQEMGCFTSQEIQAVQQAIRNHSDKGQVHAPLDELLKDADVCQHYLYNPAKHPELLNHPRVKRVLAGLATS